MADVAPDDAVSGTSEAPTPSPNEADEAIAHDTVANLADVAPDDAVAAPLADNWADNWTELDAILQALPDVTPAHMIEGPQ